MEKVKDLISRKISLIFQFQVIFKNKRNSRTIPAHSVLPGQVASLVMSLSVSEKWLFTFCLYLRFWRLHFKIMLERDKTFCKVVSHGSFKKNLVHLSDRIFSLYWTTKMYREKLRDGNGNTFKFFFHEILLK